jgi:hypothetical protein
MSSIMNNRMQNRYEIDFAMMSTSSVFKDTSIYNNNTPLSVARQYAGIYN